MTKSSEGVLLTRGLRVGVLGGSFDPPHTGHLHLSLEAMKRFDLDRVLWLISPGNPLKASAPAPLPRRLEAAQKLVSHPRILISDFEARHQSRYTYETLKKLQHTWDGVNFIWLMGADNLSQFHRWENWRGIMRTVPVGVLARPGLRIDARTSVASRIFRSARLNGRNSRLLGRKAAPQWCFVNMPMTGISSSQIRASGAWASGNARLSE
ncbi:nicotinate-nucleotide adenylyltransferase [Pelagimonas varians]|uniref:Probable nicotinate-nucleotide adenylyltransferase n=1 Tax=Pelagimonas varians TaxID=696760 RepID=A0A238K3Y0_9RHOB|nr:nicotinate-nucleotide adenylyltransferase [Pelagimonas varians]PYG30445.1 nicotinate-nucleotide adenylyltransferase [Pelagimonas varians]SMX37599.1 putative nicotinate-nucleotide adenylyltransferase [Pelagimonas varians]